LFHLQAEIRHHPVCDVVEVIVDVHYARQWSDVVAFDKGVRHRVTGRKTARYRYEIAGHEFAGGLLFNELGDVGNRHPLHRIVLHMTSGVEGRLEINTENCRMLNGELDNFANFVLVYSAFDGGDEGHAETDLRQPVQRPELLIQDVGFAAQNAIRFWGESIELEVKRGLYLV